jgi:eukaryotic-like serine/threonine-protein kinase
VVRLIKYFLLSLALLLVCLTSALVSMRFAIHGREVRVPNFVRLTPLDAERLANSQGLVLSLENRFYSEDVHAGYIVSQSPAPGAKVRRGWKVRLAESLGPQRAPIPNVVGESERVAELNISRRGLEIGAVASIHSPGSQPSTVIAQSPAAEDRNVVSPKISLLLATPDDSQVYIMPNFVGQTIRESESAVRQAGFKLGAVNYIQNIPAPSATVVSQTPLAGQRIAAGAMISFDVRE